MQLALVATDAQAQDQPKAKDPASLNRVALVVGNANYKNVAQLANPSNDAQDVAETLGRIGFVVNKVDDVDYVSFRNAVLEFKRSAQSADMAILYFAGHGIEIEGENWLLPVDAELRSDADAPSEAIGLRWAMGAVEGARSLGLVILDACRNNPFKTTMKRARLSRAAADVGLAPVDTADNVLVAYASRHGTIARDGAGRNSPFTAALLRHIETPGLELDFLFRNIRDDVIAATSELQQPVLYGSLSSDEIFLVPPPAGQVADPDQPDAVEVAWSFIKETDDVASLTQFVERFKGNRHTDEAREKIAMLQSRSKAGDKDAGADPKPASADNRAPEVETKIAARPFRRDSPAIKEAWEVVKQSRDQQVIRRFAEQFPTQERRATANKRLADLGQQPVRFNNAALPVISYETTTDQIQQTLMGRATRDTDVLSCMASGAAGACGRALVKYPGLGEFLTKDSFTSGVCARLGRQMGDCSGFIATNPTIASIRNDAGGARDQSPGLASINANANSPGGSGPGGNSPPSAAATPASTAYGANNPGGGTQGNPTAPTANTSPTKAPMDATSPTPIATLPTTPSAGDGGTMRPASVDAPTAPSKGGPGQSIKQAVPPGMRGGTIKEQAVKPGLDLTLAKPGTDKPGADKPPGVATPVKPGPDATPAKPGAGGADKPPGVVTSVKPAVSTRVGSTEPRGNTMRVSRPAISTSGPVHRAPAGVAATAARSSVPSGLRAPSAAGSAASSAAGQAAARAAGRTASHSAGNAAGRAASSAASGAAGKAATNAAGNAAASAAARAAGRAASDAAGRVAATSASRATADAAGRAATTAAGKAAADAASRARVPPR